VGSSVADKYLAESAPSPLKASPRFHSTSAINAWLKPHLGELPIRAINAKAVRDLEREMARAGLGPSGKRAYLIALYSVVKKYAVEAELLDKVPKLPPLPKAGRTIPCVMSLADFTSLLEKGGAMREHRLLFLLAGHGGLRRSEIRALRCRDVELANNRLVVRTALYATIEDKPKSGHEREVPLTPELREALVAARVDERDGAQRVALTSKGKPWPQSSLRPVFLRALQRAGLTKWRLHDLRHFFVTALLNAGVPAHVVRELAGHSDLATTQRYAHATARDRSAAITALSAACAAVPGSSRRVGGRGNS